jgi:hypothetical protein
VNVRAVGLVGALVLSALVLSACGTQSPSAAMRKWSTSSNLPSAITQLTSDARHALSALDDPRITTKQLHTVCAVLDFETLQANASLPTPDTQTTTLLSAAYTDLGDGANVCYAAASSARNRGRATAYLHRAGAELAEARARVDSLLSS